MLLSTAMSRVACDKSFVQTPEIVFVASLLFEVLKLIGNWFCNSLKLMSYLSSVFK